MARCIHPSCDCTAYEDAKHSKGTLLQLRLGCQQCGHQASEHRQLTTVDRLIEKEVSTASGKRCAHIIPATEIPHSPVFGPHDPIPIPFDDALNKESGVSCTCVGFQVTSLVRLWQKFRTYTTSDAVSALPQVKCSFCQHPLLNHQNVEDGSLVLSSAPLSESTRTNYVLKASATLELKLVNSRCVQLISHTDMKGSFTLVGLAKTDSGQEVTVCSNYFRQSLKEEEIVEVGPTTSKHPSDMQAESSKSSEDDANAAVTKKDTGESLLQQECVSTESLGTSRPQNMLLSREGSTSAARRGRKRKKHIPPLGGIRRSERLSAKKPKIELVPKQNISSRGTRKNLAKQTPSSRSTTVVEVHAESNDVAQKQLWVEKVTQFTELLKRSQKYTQYRLPKELSGASFQLMVATCCCQDPDTGQSGLLLAIGTTDGKLFLCAPSTDGSVHCVPAFDTPATSDFRRCTYYSLCWHEQLSPGCKSSRTTLFGGTSTGAMHTWTVKLGTGSERVQCSFVGEQKLAHTAAATTCSCAPNGRMLAAGNLFGEVSLYSVDGESALQQLQSIHCCGAPVACLAWSGDCSILAVGGNDDCVRVLQSDSPVVDRSGILKYLKVESEKKRRFVHTHCLKGHQSFIADVKFVGGTLVSMGWDGQVLFWQNTEQLHVQEVLTMKNQENLPFEESEPQGGFKLGPSASVEFVPLSTQTLGNHVFMMILYDKSGNITIVCYMQQ